MNNESFECAQMAAGSAIELTKAILDSKVQNGLALIRPPGHHAMKGECNGFCIFNNIAVAGKFLKRMLFVFKIHVHRDASQCGKTRNSLSPKKYFVKSTLVIS